MELASLLFSIFAFVLSVWLGIRQWRRDGPMVRCEWAWEFEESDEGQRNPDPFLIVKAINYGRGPTQVAAFGFLKGKEDQGEIGFLSKRDDIYGPQLPHTLEGGHLARWACGFDLRSDPPLRPYVVIVTRRHPKRVAKKPITPAPKS